MHRWEHYAYVRAPPTPMIPTIVTWAAAKLINCSMAGIGWKERQRQPPKKQKDAFLSQYKLKQGKYLKQHK